MLKCCKLKKLNKSSLLSLGYHKLLGLLTQHMVPKTTNVPACNAQFNNHLLLTS